MLNSKVWRTRSDVMTMTKSFDNASFYLWLAGTHIFSMHKMWVFPRICDSGNLSIFSDDEEWVAAVAARIDGPG